MWPSHRPQTSWQFTSSRLGMSGSTLLRGWVLYNITQSRSDYPFLLLALYLQNQVRGSTTLKVRGFFKGITPRGPYVYVHNSEWLYNSLFPNLTNPAFKITKLVDRVNKVQFIHIRFSLAIWPSWSQWTHQIFSGHLNMSL